jgi:hypothetical protein
MIYLRFITEKWSVESALVRLGTRSWASHVDFVRAERLQICIEHDTRLNDDGTCRYCRYQGKPFVLDMQSYCLSYNPIDTLGSRLDGGVQIRPYNYCRPTREEWYTAPHIEDAYEFGKTLIGSKYDLSDILGIGADEDWHTDGRYICSEYIAYSGEFRLIPGGVEKVIDPWLNSTTPTWHVTPRDLLCFAPLTFVRRVI